MNLKQLLTTVLVLMLAISPAMAAYCDASCSLGQLMPDAAHTSSVDMADCHQHLDQQPAENTTDFHDDCGMTGCHTASSAIFFQADAYPPVYDSSTLHSRFIPTALSADLPPPIKPPA